MQPDGCKIHNNSKKLNKFQNVKISEVNKMAECPVCGADVTLEADAEQGEIIACDDCGSELEVTGKDSLQEAPQEEEDWGE
jgi:alpha-aminoadipate carrier protein LysW